MNEPAQTTSNFWKILQFPLIRIVLAFIGVLVPVGIIQTGIALFPASEASPMILFSTLTVVAVATLAYYAFVRIIEKRPVTELSTSGAVVELGSGILVGALLFTITIGILWLLGYYTVSGINKLAVIVPVFALSVVAGIVEEILFRGILFRIIEESLGTWIGLAITALFFGLAHLFNPNATFTAAIAIALEAGVLLAAAYILTRRLWLAMGIHFAWNFVQGGIFGVAISGIQGEGLLQGSLNGPKLLTGGEFGAEASIFAVIVCLTAGIYFIWRARQKGHFIKPFWQR